ncbi:MAG: flagellar hook-basal body protein, partial [Ruminiclostridium sp.]|nr:flagellar hook-basal body protein [Ruminiclostridium sp.]
TFDISGFTDTNQPLNWALPNDGFFLVRDYNGNEYLTRDGDFHITNVDDHWELVNSNGDFVLDYEGNHIVVPFVWKEDIEGVLQETDTINYAELTDMIGVYTVPNNWGLAQDDGNHFLITERSGQPTPDEGLDKLEYYLERSNVDMAEEMVNMIIFQRGYQLDAKIVQYTDEMQQIANNIR